MAFGTGPVTAAIRALRAAGVEFTEHLYVYEERGGTRVSARELGIDEHSIVKTLVLKDDRGEPLLALMHGDMNVSTRNLARLRGSRSIEPCEPATARKHTGYLVGGTSPFGTRRTLPVFLQRSILDLRRVYVNGGKRGFLVGIDPKELIRLLQATLVDVALPRS
jgi:Cys-tRNA(Pro) deacylase